jgi:hypothetical protein
MKIDNFFAELKRRNVYKAAIAYIVGGWALSQGIAQVFPVFDVPNWAIRLIVVLIILGLPVALALAELIAIASETGAYQIAEVYAYRNDKDHAFEWLERARRQRDAGLPGLRPDTLLPNLHDDPRWTAFLRKMGLADDQLK